MEATVTDIHAGGSIASLPEAHLQRGNWPLAGQQGCYCAFTPLFMPKKLARRIEQLSIFTAKQKWVVQLSRAQAAAVSRIFELFLVELTSEYAHKLDLMRNYVVQMIHFGLKNAGGAA